MTLEHYAYVFEILASLAVVVSLIFVGIQLSRANREARNATLQAAMFREMDNSFQFSQYAATWDKVLKGQPLSDGEELRRGIALLPIFQHWRDAPSGRNHSNEFVAYVERLLPAQTD